MPISIGLNLKANGTDDGPVLQAALDTLAPGGEITVPPGNYLLSGIQLRNYDTTLRFVPGTTISISNPLELLKSRTRLLGPVCYSRTSDEIVPSPLFTWTGAAGGTMVIARQNPAGTELNGCIIDGVELYGGINGLAGVTALALSREDGITPGGFSFGTIRNLVARQVYRGILVGMGSGQTYLSNIRLHNSHPSIISGSVGLAVGTAGTFGAISIYATGGTIENFDTLIEVGGADSSPDTVRISDFAGLDGFITAALHVKRGARIYFDHNHVESGDSSLYRTAIILGSSAGIAKHVHITANDLLDQTNGGWLIEGRSFDGGLITGNSFTSLPGFKIWRNACVGQARAMRYFGNFLSYAGAGLIEIDNPQGFSFIEGSQPTGNAPNEQHAYLDVMRYAARLGRTLTPADFSLSADWGSSRSISVVGTDTRGVFTVTSGGTGQNTGASLTLTFKDLSWGSAPFVTIVRNGGAQPSTAPIWSTTATTMTVTFPSLPIAGESYTFSYCVMG